MLTKNLQQLKSEAERYITMKPLVTITGGAVALVALTWGLAYHGLVFTSVFAPQYENIRRKLSSNQNLFVPALFKNCRICSLNTKKHLLNIKQHLQVLSVIVPLKFL